jgi:uncharacterized protein involved in outer membrane biogenesis
MRETQPRSARLRNLLLSTPALVVAALLAVYVLLGFFAAPWLLRQQLPQLLERQLGATVAVGAVRVNPFLFRVELDDLSLADKKSEPAIRIGRLLVDFETSSLLRWAWTFREIRIERPVIHAELGTDEQLNLVRLFAPRDEHQAEQKSDAPGKPPRLLLQHFAISGGGFRFIDRTLQPAAVASFDPIQFEIHDVSTLPGHDGEHRLRARLPGGGDLQWQGRLSLSPLDASGFIQLKDGKLATLWQFVQDHLAIAEPEGAFEIGLRYRLRYQGGALDLQTEDMALRLKDVAIAPAKGGTLAKISSAALEGGHFDLRKRSLAFGELRIGSGAVNVSLDEEGKADWAKLLRPAATQSAPKPSPAETPPATAKEPWQIALPNTGIGPLALSVTDRSRVRPLQVTLARAEASLGLSMTAGTQTQLLVDNGNLKLDGMDLRSGDEREPLIVVATAELAGARYDLQQNAAGAALLRLSGGKTLAIREADGTFNLAAAFAGRRDEPEKPSTFKLALDRAEIADHALGFADRSFQPALAYDLEQLRFSATKVLLPAKGAIPLELNLRVRQGGTLQARGSLNLAQQSADIRVELEDLALAPLETVLKRHTTVTLASGKAGASGQVIWNGKKSPASIRYAGDAAITDFELKTEAGGEGLFRWQRFTASGIDYDSGENRLVVTRLHLAQPYARLVINKDRSTNLAAIRRGAPAPAAKPAAEPPPAGPPMAVSIERVNVERGSMDFTDLSLVLPFSTTIQSLGGLVSGLSSAPESRASLKFEGRVEEYGLARAEGAIQPFAPKKFTDIAVIFRNVELTPLSPYTATFAGRKIASGKLSLDLQYKLDNSKLAGDNKVLLEQFTLGERVESPTAVNLPLDLAIALLTDSDGKIDLAVPVSGDVDQPEFSYGHIVWQAIRTVITRIVTAPFRALGALFGGGSDDAGDIMFDPGSARILPTEYEKLRRVAEVLQKRPQLKLVVQGLYHKDSDSRALRTRAVRADLAAREGQKLAAGEDPGPVGFDNAKTQRALENMLDARAGGSAAAQFAEAFRKTAGRDAARVNPVLAVMGRGAGDRDLYVAMHRRLVELQPLPDNALAELGTARSDGIIRAFTTRLKLEPARLASKPAEAADETVRNGVPLKLSFEPIPAVAAQAAPAEKR